ncbi:MAG: putative secreted beta-glucosidase [Cyanobacteria bacterium RYN_339]|nr:putative secreted beta-glucosidase [Cyanobacteria bacterium RYN_339]
MFHRLLLSLVLLLALARPAAAYFPFDDDAGVAPSNLGQNPFLWGVALSGYQNDGSVPSMDWYALEHSGKLRETSANGPDFRGHMDADLDLAKSLGLTAFRTSIEWARIEPQQGQIDADEVAYVHRLLQGIRKRGMTPIVTLHHFATPQWAIADRGDGLMGWESARTTEAYLKYVEFVAKEYGKEIDYYITFNEPSTLIGGAYLLGWTVPYKMGPMATARAVLNVLTGHLGAYERLHALDPGCMVTLAEYNSFFPVANTGFYYLPNQIAGLLMEKEPGWDGKPRVKAMDFIALHYYGTVDAGALQFPVQPYNWGVSTSHFHEILKAYHETFHLPILVAENGFATKNGSAREDGWTRESYMVAHIQEIMRARADGIPIIGYLYWTLTDNFEWGSYEPRFGLWSVDCSKGDLTRRETPAAAVYREIIKQHGVTAELAKRYPPPDTLTGAR